MNFNVIPERLNMLAEEILASAATVKPDTAGLDPRSVSSLWIGLDFIAAPMGEIANMEYYGGFEYVARSARQVIGNYVFYSTADSRVYGHWEQATEAIAADNPPLCHDCNGSGEGMCDNTLCRTCQGQGTLQVNKQSL